MRIYGTTELAQAVAARPRTVSMWHRRGKLPKPTAELAMGPVWTGREIERWIDATIDERGGE